MSHQKKTAEVSTESYDWQSLFLLIVVHCECFELCRLNLKVPRENKGLMGFFCQTTASSSNKWGSFLSVHRCLQAVHSSQDSTLCLWIHWWNTHICIPLVCLPLLTFSWSWEFSGPAMTWNSSWLLWQMFLAAMETVPGYHRNGTLAKSLGPQQGHQRQNYLNMCLAFRLLSGSITS